MEEEAQPGALAAAFAADPIHAVVPVAAADERQAMSSGGRGTVDGAETVLVETRSLG